MKRTEYSFGKIDFNGSRAVIPTETKGLKPRGFQLLCFLIPVLLNVGASYLHNSNTFKLKSLAIFWMTGRLSSGNLAVFFMISHSRLFVITSKH